MTETLTIGKAARATGLPVKTIRFYEDAGVVRASARSAGGYRLYSELDVRKLRLARRARLLGLPVEDVRELVESAFASACAEYAVSVAAIASRRRMEVEEAISELLALRAELDDVLLQAESASSRAPAGMRVAECPCCLLMEAPGANDCCTSEAPPLFPPEEIEVMEILACSIAERPAGAPGADALQPLLLRATVEGGLATLQFAPEAAATVAAFAAAERLCCKDIGWEVDGATLRVRGTPVQMEALSRWWLGNTGEAAL